MAIDLAQVEDLLLLESFDENQIDQFNDFAWINRHTQKELVKKILPKTKLESNKIEYQKGIAYSDRVLAHLLLDEGNFANALEVSLSVIDQMKNLNEPRGLSDALNSLGGVYNYLEDYENRLKCNLRCLEIREEIDDNDGMVASLNNIGDTFLCLNQPEKAIIYFNQALLNDQLSLTHRCILNNNLGEAYFQLGDLNKAHKYFIDAQTLSLETNYSAIKVNTEIYISRIHLKNQEYSKATDILLDTLEDVKKTNSQIDQLHIHQFLSQVFEGLKDKNSAFDHLKKHNELQQSLYGKNVIQKIKNIQFEKEFEVVQKESETIKEINEELKTALEKIDEQNREIGHSINYARLIQDSILPNEDQLRNKLNDAILFYSPKDHLSGDFYWFREFENYQFVAVADCTGHGIPAALLSALCISALDRAIMQAQITETGKILDFVTGIISQQLDKNKDLKDGMDISLIAINQNDNSILWSGANTPLFVVEQNEIYTIKATKQAIGHNYNQRNYETHKLNLAPGSFVFLYSDGYQDQFGGEFNKKLKASRFKEILQESCSLTIDEANQYLASEFKKWQGNSDQTDDVCVLGFRI